MKPLSLVVILVDVSRAKSKIEMLDERLITIKGRGSYGFGDANGLCLVPDMVIPPKFKVLEFEKY